jgi:beta-glucanase (GH16 family)
MIGINFILPWRYRLFRKWCKPVDFSNGKLVFSDDFRNLDNFNVKDNEFYNDNDVWFSKEAVIPTDEGLKIVCRKDPAHHTSWNGDRQTTWTSGMIDTRDKFEHPHGTWVFEAKICNSWPAIWLLRRDRKEPGYERVQITPEVDIVEICKGYLRHTVHYGYSNTVYKTHEKGSDIFKCDNLFHTYAVVMSPKGYKFYVDGILTASLKSKHPDFTSYAPCYLIINNAASKPNNDDQYDFIIRSVRVYQ